MERTYLSKSSWLIVEYISAVMWLSLQLSVVNATLITATYYAGILNDNIMVVFAIADIAVIIGWGVWVYRKFARLEEK